MAVEAGDGPGGAAGAAPDLPDLGLTDFRVLSRLGEGGMGVVYRARQLSMERDVALKILPERFARDPEYVERFYREARLSARLDHPNIVRGIAVGEERGIHYFAMELVEGESLDRLLQREGKLGLRRSVAIAIRIAEALEYAHEKGLVHRDVKPGNVILTADGRVKLADLGLARLVDDEQTLSRGAGALGTPAYNAPEQMRDPSSADVATDLYALGATLYHMITGRKPFAGRSPIEIFAAKERGDRAPARSLVPGLPVAVDTVLDRLLTPDPLRRYRSAREVMAALEHLDEQPGRQHVLTPTHTAARRLWRRFWLQGAAAVIVTGTVFLLARQIGLAPTGSPSQRQPMAFSDADSLLASALAAIAGGEPAKAQELLAQAADSFPGAADLHLLHNEMRQGLVVLLQRDIPGGDETITPWWSLEAIPMSAVDSYRYAFLASRACHVGAFQVDQHQGAVRIFPNERYTPTYNPLRPGRVHWLPAPDGLGPLWLHLEGAPRSEWVVLIAATGPLPPFEELEDWLNAAQGTSLPASLESWIAKQLPHAQPCFTDGFTRSFRIIYR